MSTAGEGNWRKGATSYCRTLMVRKPGRHRAIDKLERVIIYVK